ncbi:MAG: hypothetical protein ABUT20_26565 [Bacteroidota bacterium]
MSNNNHIVLDSLPAPWHWDEIDLTNQLKKEMPSGHVLATKKLKSIARRQDNDDALFEIDSEDYKYVVIHLTWSQKRLIDIKYPSAELYKDWDDVYANRILKDKESWDELEKE